MYGYMPAIKRQILVKLGCRDGAAIKRTCCSYRRTGLVSQDLHAQSQSVTQILRDLTASSGLCGCQADPWYTDIGKIKNTQNYF